MIEKIKELVKGKCIEDIVICGFVDIENGVAEFCNQLYCVFIEVDGRYIKLEAVDQNPRLQVSITDKLDYSDELDEDMFRAYYHANELILCSNSEYGNDIKRISFYIYNEITCECDAIEFEVGNGQVIFFDPSYYYGFNIGGEFQKKVWQNEYADSIAANECNNIVLNF